MFKRLVILALLLVLGSLIVSAQEPITGAVGGVHLSLRAEPNTNSARIMALAPGTQFVVEARDEFGGWLLVNVPSANARGWVALDFVNLSRPVRIMEEIPLVGAAAAPPQADVPVEMNADGTPQAVGTPVPTPGPPPERTDYPPVYMTDAVWNNVRAIYARGRQLGNDPFSLMKVGESNTAGTVYLCNFEWREYDLGSYTHLQPIVDGFSATGSFCRGNVTAQNGFATVNVLDPLFAPQDVCLPNENALQCEYRRAKPSYAFIYMGMADHGVLTAEEYGSNLTMIVNFLSQNGVIPILQTYPTSDKWTDGKPQEFNEMVRQVARLTNVPLLDIRAALYNYDNRGTGPDGYHLSVRNPAETTFTGDEFVYGRTYRELQSLQILYDLHTALNS